MITSSWSQYDYDKTHTEYSLATVSTMVAQQPLQIFQWGYKGTVELLCACEAFLKSRYKI